MAKPSRHRLGRYGVELLVVFLGVWLGLMAETYREFRNDREREQAALRGLVSDLAQNRSDVVGNLGRAERSRDATYWLLSRADFAGVPADTLSYHLCRLQQISGLNANSATYSSLRSAGQLGLIQSTGLRDGLTGLYEVYPTIVMWHDRENTELRAALAAIAPLLRPSAEAGVDCGSFRGIRLHGTPDEILGTPEFTNRLSQLFMVRRYLAGTYVRVLAQIDTLTELAKSELDMDEGLVGEEGDA